MSYYDEVDTDSFWGRLPKPGFNDCMWNDSVLRAVCAEVDRLRLALAASRDEAEKAKADTARLESRFQCWLAMVLAKENCINTVLDILEELKEASESPDYLRESVARECDKAVDAAIDAARATPPGGAGENAGARREET